MACTSRATAWLPTDCPTACRVGTVAWATGCAWAAMCAGRPPARMCRSSHGNAAPAPINCASMPTSPCWANGCSSTVDEQLSPGKASTQEAYVRLNGEARLWHLKGGQIYLPFGWRLQDSTAFVRAVSGIGMSTPERGAELGVELGDWSAQLALTRPLAPTPGQLRPADHGTTRVGAELGPHRRLSGVGPIHGRQAPGLGLVRWPAHRPRGLAGRGRPGARQRLPEGRRSLLAALGELNWKVAQGHN
jgi:hypothetical protein